MYNSDWVFYIMALGTGTFKIGICFARKNFYDRYCNIDTGLGAYLHLGFGPTRCVEIFAAKTNEMIERLETFIKLEYSDRFVPKDYREDHIEYCLHDVTLDEIYSWIEDAKSDGCIQLTSLVTDYIPKNYNQNKILLENING